MKKVYVHLIAFAAIVISAVYQVHCAIHGFDLTDEGYLMSIFQWFCDDIEYAKGCGGYPLTCWIGSMINSLYTEGGILEMRLWGVAIVTLTELLIYGYLQRWFPPMQVLLGLLLQTAFVAGDPKPFGYNTLTAFIGVIAFIMVTEGALRKRLTLLAVGGLLLGVNVFVRLPNITCMAFALIPFWVNWRSKTDWRLKPSCSQAAIVLTGFAIGMVGTWQVVSRLGAADQVTDLLGSLSGTLEGESTHASSAMMLKYLNNYATSVWQVLVFAFTTVLAGVGFKFKHKPMRLLMLFLAFMVLYHNTYMNSNMLGDSFVEMMNGLGIAGACFLLRGGVRHRSIALGAVLLSLLLPLGSDGGFETMWVGTWVLLPVGLSGLYYFISDAADMEAEASFSFSMPQTGKRLAALRVPATALRYGYVFSLMALLVATVVKIEHKSYYDPGNRIDKTYAIDSRKAKGIYTSKERASVVNPLLKELKKHVNAGDVMLVYDSSPLLYYLTETRPFAGISWPCVFYGHQYVKKFHEAEAKTETMPVLVMQYYFSSNFWTEVMPSYYLPADEGGVSAEGTFSDPEMKRDIMRFIKSHGYHTVWSNRYYDIMLPAQKEALGRN